MPWHTILVSVCIPKLCLEGEVSSNNSDHINSDAENVHLYDSSLDRAAIDRGGGGGGGM